jgi:hypothetical protein
MSQTLSILGQNFPDASVDTNLFTVSAGYQAQFSVFLANHAPEIDRITIALMPRGETEPQDANYIAYNTPVIGNAVMAFSGLFLNSDNRVQIRSANGTTSFTATGIISTA